MAFTSGGIKGLIQGALGAVTSAEKTRADQLSVRRSIGGVMAKATAVNTAGQVALIPHLPNECRIKSARIQLFGTTTQANAAADGWLFSLKYDDGAGGASTACNVSYNTAGNGGLLGDVAKAMTVASDVTIPANSRLFVLCTPTNTAVQANAVQAAFSLDIEET